MREKEDRLFHLLMVTQAESVTIKPVVSIFILWRGYINLLVSYFSLPISSSWEEESEAESQ